MGTMELAHSKYNKVEKEKGTYSESRQKGVKRKEMGGGGMYVKKEGWRCSFSPKQRRTLFKAARGC